ncbi:hypothetical protein P4H71_28130 [Paenibacillus kribbensis]|nr:hypothetical protein [Paenibacillus kribbensis]MEC0238186.1 hypothetical protein [Paenibacillus kribbensis]
MGAGQRSLPESCGAALVRYASMRTIERPDDPGGPLDSGQQR